MSGQYELHVFQLPAKTQGGGSASSIIIKTLFPTGL